MADIEDKEKHQKRLKNRYTKMLRDQNEYKGAFSLKVFDPRKTIYKREKVNPNKIFEEDNYG